METIIIQAEPKKKKALIEILKAFEVPFTVKKTKENTYDPEFVAKIVERSKNAEKGNTITINPNDLWGSLDLK